MLVILIVAALVLWLAYYVIEHGRRPHHYPPGPSWLPLIGNGPLLRQTSRKLGAQHLALQHLSQIYKTNILGLKLGNDHVVVVFGYDAVRQVLMSEEYEGRPDNFFIRLRTMGTRLGVTCTDGSFWKQQRAFVMTHLRNLGYGKRPMELLVREELDDIVHTLSNKQLEVQIGRLLAPAILNILWSLTTGQRFSNKDPKLDKLLDLLTIRSRAFDMSGGTLAQHPWMRFLAPERTGFNLVNRLNSELRQLLMDIVRRHQETWSEDRDDDFIYAYLGEMRRQDNTSGFTDEQLVMICLDIFIAGAQTTSNTLDFAFLAMVLYPEVQVKVQQHIDEALQDVNILDYNTRHRLPYVEAVLSEVERFFHVVPISGPRRTLRDTKLNGYEILQNTTILISQYSVHNDPAYWDAPEQFRPERFMQDGKFVPNERLIPFGLGKRRCLGELLAKTCIFMFFTEIVRKFSIGLKPGSSRPTGKPIPGLTLTPERYAAVFTER